MRIYDEYLNTEFVIVSHGIERGVYYPCDVTLHSDQRSTVKRLSFLSR